MCIGPAVPPVGHLHRLHELTHDTPVTLNYAVLSDYAHPHYNALCRHSLHQLLTHQLFDVARQFADVTGLPSDHITIQQVPGGHYYQVVSVTFQQVPGNHYYQVVCVTLPGDHITIQQVIFNTRLSVSLFQVIKSPIQQVIISTRLSVSLFQVIKSPSNR